jgi:hypothetical protein
MQTTQIMQHVFTYRRLILRKAIVRAQQDARHGVDNSATYAWNSGVYYSYLYERNETIRTMTRKLP